MRTRFRQGYTLFQLLVLLAVLLLLLGMLLPSVLRMQQAAARARSSSHLKMLAIAMHSFHDAQGILPAGVDSNHFSALSKVLPYIEQSAVFMRIDFTKTADSDDNAPMRQVRIQLFESDLDPAGPPDEKAGPTSYMMVAGTKEDLERNNGIFHRDSRLTMATITSKDGASNTIMAIETLKGDGGKKAESVARQHVRRKKADLKGLKEETGVKDFKDGKNIAGNRGSSWMDGRFLQATITITREFNSERPDVDCEGAGGLAAPRSLQKGTLVMFADGSVRFLSDATAFKVWQAIATHRGGEAVNFE